MNDRYCAVYLRVSTNGQELGLESQERAVRLYLEQNQISSFKIFSDLGQSGAKSSRPALDEMMSEVRLGRVHAVITFSISRLGRNIRNLLDLVEEFKKHNTVFVSITEKIDDSPVGRLLLAILGALSAMELENTRIRVKAGIANCRAKGIQLGRRKSINHQLILELHSKGYKQIEIAKLLKCSRASVSMIIKFNKSRRSNS